jgi:hypothetical protein
MNFFDFYVLENEYFTQNDMAYCLQSILMIMFDSRLLKLRILNNHHFLLSLLYSIDFFRVNLHFRPIMFVQKMFLKYIDRKVEKEKAKGRVFVFQESMYLIIHSYILIFIDEKKKELLLFIFRHTLQSLIGKHLCVV